MSKDSEKQSAQGFAQRNADCREVKFETEGFPANTKPEHMPLGAARMMAKRNIRKINEQRPTPVRSGK